jgi:hypothetical protein
MTVLVSAHQKVLASFLANIINAGGWWYRVPTGKIRGKDDPILPQDSILPHFGTVFGLTEEAAAIILTEMALLTYNSGEGTYQIRRKGWEDLASMFQVDELLELKTKVTDQVVSGDVGSCLHHLQL